MNGCFKPVIVPVNGCLGPVSSCFETRAEMRLRELMPLEAFVVTAAVACRVWQGRADMLSAWKSAVRAFVTGAFEEAHGADGSSGHWERGGD